MGRTERFALLSGVFTIAVGLGAATLAEPAAAATPILSGAYAYSGTTTCQSKTTVTFGSAGVEFTLGSAGVEFTTGQVMYTSTEAGTGVRTVRTGSVVKTVRTDSMVRYLQPDSRGRINESIGTLTFNNSTKRVTIKRIIVAGDALRGLGGVNGGEVMTRRAPAPTTSSFSNTDTTVSLTGLSLNPGGSFDVVYGNIVNGIARHVNLLRKEGTTKEYCAFRGTLVRQ